MYEYISQKVPTADLTDMLSYGSTIFLWSYGTTIFIQETQIAYTQYVGNDVYVDDVDDDEAGAGAYFLLLRHSDAQMNYSGQAFLDF